jgi:hypothetical protein
MRIVHVLIAPHLPTDARYLSPWKPLHRTRSVSEAVASLKSIFITRKERHLYAHSKSTPSHQTKQPPYILQHKQKKKEDSPHHPLPSLPKVQKQCKTISSGTRLPILSFPLFIPNSLLRDRLPIPTERKKLDIARTAYSRR